MIESALFFIAWQMIWNAEEGGWVAHIFSLFFLITAIVLFVKAVV